VRLFFFIQFPVLAYYPFYIFLAFPASSSAPLPEHSFDGDKKRSLDKNKKNDIGGKKSNARLSNQNAGRNKACAIIAAVS
jgi:hypothetical protein